jgi:DNA polymerase III epsilon subunit-like protein
MPSQKPSETFISVDVETAGPIPRLYSMLSIGACFVEEPTRTFYTELKPELPDFVEAAMAVSGLSLPELEMNGTPPVDAMREFDEWLANEVPTDSLPVFVGFNAPFDWMFIDDYFHRLLGRNPFGHTAIDIKSYGMGVLGGTWSETSMRSLSPRFLGGRKLAHNALGDAQDQAELFRAIRAERDRLKES